MAARSCSFVGGGKAAADRKSVAQRAGRAQQGPWQVSGSELLLIWLITQLLWGGGAAELAAGG